jgi:gamma-glutamyl-gamma-aminobutyrate hydrolase PuuD
VDHHGLMTRPLIGITSEMAAAGWGDRVREAVLLPASYARAIERSGCVPVLLPYAPYHAADLVSGLDGLVFSDGPDLGAGHSGISRQDRAGHSGASRQDGAGHSGASRQHGAGHGGASRQDGAGHGGASRPGGAGQPAAGSAASAASAAAAASAASTASTAPAASAASTASAARDASEFALMRAAILARLPLLAIGRGMHLLNAAKGGSLTDHHGDNGTSPGPVTWIARDVRLSPDSKLGQLLGPSLTVQFARAPEGHDQTVDRLGNGLAAAAWADGESVEAIELAGHPFALGVRWHPEQDDDLRIFEGLRAAAGSRPAAA